MHKYKLIVADTNNTAYSKMSAMVAQAIGAGFGYPNGQISPADEQVLVFNPNTKTVCVTNRNQIDTYSTVFAFTPDYLVNALQSPELNSQLIENTNGIQNATIFEDSVTFRSKTSKLVGTVTIPKEFVLEVANRMGAGMPASDKVRIEDLPLVTFCYPDSRKYQYQDLSRVVRVSSMNKDYICGYETLRAGVAPDSPVYKKYSRARVSELQLKEFNP